MSSCSSFLDRANVTRCSFYVLPSLLFISFSFLLGYHVPEYFFDVVYKKRFFVPSIKSVFSCRLTRRRGFRKRQLVWNSSGNLFEQTVRRHFMPRSWNAYFQHTATRTQNAEFSVQWVCSRWILELHGSFVTIDDHVWPALCSYRRSFTFSIE